MILSLLQARGLPHYSAGECCLFVCCAGSVCALVPQYNDPGGGADLCKQSWPLHWLHLGSALGPRYTFAVQP